MSFCGTVALFIPASDMKNGQDFRTGLYFIMHMLLCFKKTIAITIDVLSDCGAYGL